MKRLTTMMAGFALVALLLQAAAATTITTRHRRQARRPPARTATETQQEAIPAVVKVSIGDNFYKPKGLTIKRGQSISWRNEGAVAHTVTSDTDSPSSSTRAR